RRRRQEHHPKFGAQRGRPDGLHHDGRPRRLTDEPRCRRRRCCRCPLRVISGHRSASTPCPLYSQKRTSTKRTATSALCQKRTSSYSMIVSARASTAGGIVSPSALAVLRLIASSYLVGACTGKSAGFSPLRMRST